jgi:inosine-uridine nucleoside N-ribohydrolase
LLGVVACGGQEACNRALLASSLLAQYYNPRTSSIPIATGADGAKDESTPRHEPAEYEYCIEGFDNTGTDNIPAAGDFLRETLMSAEDGSVTVQIQAAFTDVALLLQSDAALFKRKVRAQSVR